MKQMTSEVKQQQLGWRRAQVLELASAGYTQREIASKLQVDLAAVNRDIFRNISMKLFQKNTRKGW
jgi:DNA-binding NarL/FixJ family response regulator